MYNYDHMSGTDWIGMGFMMVFVVIVLLVAIWAITQWTRTSDRPHLPADKSACDILDERFARGEIEIDEYQDRRRALDHLPVG
jgi:putative membrane protein